MNTLIGQWQAFCCNYATNRGEVIPCKICGYPTRMLGTKLCDGCWEVTTRLRNFISCQNGVDFVKQILENN